jgi:hypothetical protein
MEYELYHHGIKGQRWGIRRYQKNDGSLTPAGKKRYYDTPELNKQKASMDTAKARRREAVKKVNKASNLQSAVPTDANRKAYEKADSEYRKADAAYRKSKLKYKTNKEVARIHDKGVEFDKKSKHRTRLEEQYKKIGMTDEQAQAAANNRIRTEKILAGSAAMTIGAGALYAANKYRKERIDGVIKAGETLQRVEMRDTDSQLHDIFYAAKGKHDKKRYENLLGATRQRQTGHAYMMKLEASSEIKVASKDKCVKTFTDLYRKDSDFRKYVDSHIAAYRPKNYKQAYERFNQALVEMKGRGPDKKFYDALKKNGYGAIQDINDMKFSGYNAKNPLIVFDNSKKSIMVKSMTEMTGNLQGKGTKELLKARGEVIVEDFMKKAGPLSAAALTTKTVSTYRSNPAVQNYKIQHPNTNKTDRQIAEMLGY